jgi:hypothetical protein
MKRKLLTYACVIATALFSSCSEDGGEKKPSLQFVFEGETITLAGAGLYLTGSGSVINGTHKYRNYFISDGEYTNGGGMTGSSLDDYEGETFFLRITLAIPNGEEFGEGEHIQLNNADIAGATQKICSVLFESGEGNNQIQYYTHDDIEDASPVIVSGGADDGDKMTLTLDGKLLYYYHNGTNWVEKTVTGTFYFTGTVQDERVI